MEVLKAAKGSDQRQEQDNDPTMDKTNTDMDRTKQREKEPCSGRPTDLAAGPSKRKTNRKNQNKGKAQAKHTNERKGNSKADSNKAAGRDDMDWTGLDWTYGDGHILRESRPRESRGLQAHNPLHWRRAWQAK